MPRPADTEIRIDEHGDETHESWLLVRANRVSSGPPGRRLFDSEIGHQHYIQVAITRCTRKRDLHHDWRHGRETILEMDMSEAQWGAFVSSFGNGTGVPATLSFFRVPEDVPEGLTPQAPFDSRLNQSHKEVKEATGKALENILASHHRLMEAFEAKAGRKIMGECLRDLTHKLEGAPNNLEFAAKSLTEHFENVVTKARADIESTALHAQRANPELEMGMPVVPALGMGEDEFVDAEDAEVVDE